MSMDPLIVHVTRGLELESRHEVIAVQFDSSGKKVAEFGRREDLERPVFPRSAIKPLQALALLESNGLEKFSLNSSHLALACASHQGELVHRELALAWLKSIGLKESDLGCGQQWPGSLPALQQELRSHGEPSQLTNNCSGKHLGFLTACLAEGWSLQGYKNWDHPLQKKIRKIISPLVKSDLDRAAWGIDGCGIPTMALKLESWVLAMGFFLTNATSAVQIKSAFQLFPDLIGGSADFNSRILQKLNGKVLLKNGAEGVALLCDLQNQSVLGVKALDGSARARDAVIAFFLTKWFEMRGEYPLEIKNWNQEVTGSIHVTQAKAC